MKAKAKQAPPQRGTRSDGDVDAFLRGLDHPRRKDIDLVRRTILGVDPSIREGIKWNGPSFRTEDYFATVFLRTRDAVQVIFHRGAKKKDPSAKRMQLRDPEGIVRWLAADRCMVTLGAGREVQRHRSALEAIVRAWIARV